MWILLLRRYGPILLVVLLIAGFVYSYQDRGKKINQLKDTNYTLSQRITTLTAERDSLLVSIANQNEAIQNLHDEALRYNARVAELMQRPPKVITKWRERVSTVDDDVSSTDCVTAIQQAADVLTGVQDDGLRLEPPSGG